MSLFLAVLILEDTRVYVSTMNSGNISVNIKASVNKWLGFSPTLSIPNIDPNDCHFELRGSLYDL